VGREDAEKPGSYKGAIQIFGQKEGPCYGEHPRRNLGVAVGNLKRRGQKITDQGGEGGYDTCLLQGCPTKRGKRTAKKFCIPKSG